MKRATSMIMGLAIMAGMTAIISTATATYATEIISAENPEAILNIAKGFGSAKLEKDPGGDPLITGRIEGKVYIIVFDGCENGKKCDDIHFGAAWSGKKVSLNDINRWNRDKKFGTALLDTDGDPVLRMFVNIDFGVTEKNLEDTFDWWSKALSVFKKDVLKE